MKMLDEPVWSVMRESALPHYWATALYAGVQPRSDSRRDFVAKSPTLPKELLPR